VLGAVTWNEIRSKCYEVLRGISRGEGGGILLSLSGYIETCGGDGWRLARGVVVVVVVVKLVIVIVIVELVIVAVVVVVVLVVVVVVVVVVIIVVICGGGGGGGADE
jgi:hypothetical protein